MQRLQQEQQKRMLKYQARLQAAAQARGGGGTGGGGVGNGGGSDHNLGDSYNSNAVYEEYQQMLGNYRERVHQSAQLVARDMMLAREQQQWGVGGAGQEGQHSATWRPRYDNGNGERRRQLSIRYYYCIQSNLI